MILSHHERHDGSAYPRGLQKEEILLSARIFAIADTLDAITSNRPYRRATSFQVARETIISLSGSQFDPKVVLV
jgi:HD-GYP domain-containing protein (c-di-GMP phosphodiesterase class II)